MVRQNSPATTAGTKFTEPHPSLFLEKKFYCNHIPQCMIELSPHNHEISTKKGFVVTNYSTYPLSQIRSKEGFHVEQNVKLSTRIIHSRVTHGVDMIDSKHVIHFRERFFLCEVRKLVDILISFCGVCVSQGMSALHPRNTLQYQYDANIRHSLMPEIPFLPSPPFIDH